LCPDKVSFGKYNANLRIFALDCSKIYDPVKENNEDVQENAVS
jgi:ribonucleotide reductase beta subunit family protein with ferritin-like domain